MINKTIGQEEPNMKCPICGKEMSEGYIYNGSQPLQWLPNGVMPSRINWTTTDKGVTLKNKFKFLKESGYKAEAYYCYECHLVIAPTE